MLHVDLHHLENIFVFFGVERRREKLDLLLLKDTTFTLYSLLVNKFLSLIIIFYSLPVCLVKKGGRVRIASLFDAFSCHSSSFNFSVSFTLVHVTFTSLKAAMVCQWCLKGFFKTFQNKDMLWRGTCWRMLKLWQKMVLHAALLNNPALLSLNIINNPPTSEFTHRVLFSLKSISWFFSANSSNSRNKYGI